jgi:hypothetical protein
MNRTTQYGPGDEITWPKQSGHPHDPNTRELSDDMAELVETAGEIMAAARRLREYAVAEDRPGIDRSISDLKDCYPQEWK